MDKTTLLLFGAIAAAAIVFWSSIDWRRSVKCVFVLVLFEGAIRKWILPSASDLVYFAKDAVLLGAYLGIIFKHRLSLKSVLPNLPWSLFQAIWVLLALEALNPNIGSILCAILGTRGYLFYMPLTFLMPRLFRSKDELVRQLAMYTLLAIPICLLGVLQFRSDRFSMLNKYASGISEHGASGFGLGGDDIARITGTFSYLSGHMAFVSAFFALNVALLFFDRLPYRFYLTYVSLPLLVGNAFMSGSRASLAVQGLIFVGFALSVLRGSSSAIRKRYGGLLIGAIFCAGSSIYFFSDAIDAMRFRMGAAGDGFIGRVIYHPIHDVSVAWVNGGVLGNGIGTTSSTTYSLRQRFSIPPPLFDPGAYDSELASVVAEIGVLGGLAWYLFRIQILFAIAQNLRRQKEAGYAAFALSALLISLPYFILSLLMNPVASILLWGFFGLGMAPRPAPEQPSPEPIRRRSRLPSSGAFHQRGIA